MSRHVVFYRQQILAMAKQLEEFEDIILVDYQFTADEYMQPIRVEFIWADDYE